MDDEIYPTRPDYCDDGIDSVVRLIHRGCFRSKYAAMLKTFQLPGATVTSASHEWAALCKMLATSTEMATMI